MVLFNRRLDTIDLRSTVWLCYQSFSCQIHDSCTVTSCDLYVTSHSTEVKEKSTAIPLLPFWPYTACSRVNFTFS